MENEESSHFGDLIKFIQNDLADEQDLKRKLRNKRKALRRQRKNSSKKDAKGK